MTNAWPFRAPGGSAPKLTCDSCGGPISYNDTLRQVKCLNTNWLIPHWNSGDFRHEDPITASRSSPLIEAWKLSGGLCRLLTEQPTDHAARRQLAYEAKAYARAIVELLS